MKNIIKFLVGSLFSIAIISCTTSNNPFSQEPNPEPSSPVVTEKEYVIEENVIELESNTIDYVAEVINNNGLAFNANTPDSLIPKLEQVILVPKVSTKFPAGFMGRVTNIEKQNGSTYVETEPVAIDEVFSYLKVSQSYSLTPEGAKVITKNGIGEPFNFEIKGELAEGIEANGNLSLTIDTYNEFHIDKGANVKKGTIILNLKLEGELKLDINVGKEIEEKVEIPGTGWILPPVSFGPIIFVPVIQPYLYLGINAGIKVNPSVNCEWNTSIKLDYNQAGWTFSGDPTTPPQFQFNLMPDIELSGEVSDGIGIDFDYRLYGSEDNKIFITGQIGPKMLGEVILSGDPISLYDEGKDSRVEYGLNILAEAGASAKIFKLEAGISKELFNTLLFGNKYYIFPSWGNKKYSKTDTLINVSAEIKRNLLFEQETGIALYEDENLVRTNKGIKYKDDTEEIQTIQEAFSEGLIKKGKGYDLYSYIKWGDMIVRCEKMVPIVGKWSSKSSEDPSDYIFIELNGILCWWDYDPYRENEDFPYAVDDFGWSYDEPYLIFTYENGDYDKGKISFIDENTIMFLDDELVDYGTKWHRVIGN